MCRLVSGVLLWTRCVPSRARVRRTLTRQEWRRVSCTTMACLRQCTDAARAGGLGAGGARSSRGLTSTGCNQVSDPRCLAAGADLYQDDQRRGCGHAEHRDRSHPATYRLARARGRDSTARMARSGGSCRRLRVLAKQARHGQRAAPAGHPEPTPSSRPRSHPRSEGGRSARRRHPPARPPTGRTGSAPRAARSSHTGAARHCCPPDPPCRRLRFADRPYPRGLQTFSRDSKRIRLPLALVYL